MALDENASERRKSIGICCKAPTPAGYIAEIRGAISTGNLAYPYPASVPRWDRKITFSRYGKSAFTMTIIRLASGIMGYPLRVATSERDRSSAGRPAIVALICLRLQPCDQSDQIR